MIKYIKFILTLTIFISIIFIDVIAQQSVLPHIIDSIYFPHFRPTAMAVYEEGNKVFVHDANNDNLCVINGLTNDITDSIKIPNAFGDIYINETYHKLYVESASGINIIDAQTNIILKTLPYTYGLITQDKVRNKIFASGNIAGKIIMVDAGNDSVQIISNVGMDPYGSADMNETTNELVVTSVQYNKIRVINCNDFSERQISLADLGYPLPQPLYTTINEKEDKVYYSHSTLNCLLIVNLKTEEKIITDRTRFWFGSIVVDEELNKIVSSGSDDDIIVDGATDEWKRIGSFGVGDNGRWGSGLLKSSHHVFIGNEKNVDVVDLQNNQVIRLTCNLPFSQWNFITSQVAINQTTGNIYYLFSEDEYTHEGIITVLKDGAIKDNWTTQMGFLYPTFSEPQSINSLTFNDELLGWMVGRDGYIFKTEDGGNNWTTQNSNTTFNLQDVFFTDSKTGWIIGNNFPYMSESVLLKTTNSGDDWLSLPNPVSGILNSIYFINSQVGWLGGKNKEQNKGVLLKTTDEGKTWTVKKSFQYEAEVKDVFFVDEMNGWCTTSSGWSNIYRTTDGGETWNSVGGSLDLSYTYNIFFTDKNNGWTGGVNLIPMNSRIFHTTNGGLNWTTQLSGSVISEGSSSYDEINDIYFIDSLNGWATSYWGKILHTSDGGNNWNIRYLPSGTSLIHFNKIWMNNLNNGWIAGLGNGSLAIRYFNNLDIPSCPINLNAFSIPDQLAQLTWNDNSDNETGFEILRSDYYSGNYRKIASVQAGSSSYIDSSVTPGKIYWYRVKAFNTIGYSSRSREDSVKIPLPPIPESPLLLSPLSEATNVSVNPNLSWQSSARAKTYRLQLSLNPEFSNIIFNDSTITDTSVQIKQLKLKFNTIYYWRVCAKNEGGTSNWSDTWNFTTIISAPNVPILYSPVNNSKNLPFTVTLFWYKVNNAIGYHLQLSIKQDFANFIINDSTLTDTTRKDINLSEGQKYYWRVSANNIGGNSPFSETWNFTTILIKPDSLKAENYVPNKVKLSWKDLSNSENGIIIERKSISDNFTVIDTIVSNSIEYIDQSVLGLTEYYYRINCFNDFAVSDYSNEAYITTITSVDEDNLPLVFSLYQNYPNPFNPSTTIKYDLPKESLVTLKIYNINGQEIETLVDKLQPAGRYSVNWQPKNLSSGIYFYKISTNNIFIRKMLYLK